MKASRILLFFMTVICAFFIANTAFAGYTKWTDREDKGSITARMDGVSGIPGQDMRADGSAVWDAESGLSLTPGESGVSYSLLDHSKEMFKVLSVLKKEVKDERLLKKIVEKLPSLSNERLRIMVSLSERMSSDDHSAKKDFAFLLLTTLIVFS